MSPCEKYCPQCKITKPRSDFSPRSGNRSHQLRGVCKACNAENAIQRRETNRNRFYALLRASNAHCIDCGESRLVLLDFDHIDPTTKINHVSRLLDHKFETLLREIDKCEIRCANCHRLKTAEQFGYRKLDWEMEKTI